MSEGVWKEPQDVTLTEIEANKVAYAHHYQLYINFSQKSDLSKMY